MKTDVRTHQRQRTTERANRVDWPGGLQPRGARRNQATRPVQSKPREGGPRPNPGENTQERIGTKSNRTQPWRELEDPSPTGTLNSFLEEGATGSDSKLTDQRRKKSPLPRRDSAEATDLNRNGVNEYSRPGERKRSPGADPSDDPSTRKRDEWKASTRIEGDSKEPSASMATRTCRKAGARDKHTRDVITTPRSVRGEEERLEQALGKRPEERKGPPDSAPQARHRQSGGRPTSKTARGNNPAGRTSAAPRPITLERQRLQRKRQGRNGRQAPKPPHQLPIREEGTKPETEQKERPKADVHSVSGAKATVNIREAAVPEETRQAQDEKNRRAAEAATA